MIDLSSPLESNIISLTAKLCERRLVGGISLFCCKGGGVRRLRHQRQEREKNAEKEYRERTDGEAAVVVERGKKRK